MFYCSNLVLSALCFLLCVTQHIFNLIFQNRSNNHPMINYLFELFQKSLSIMKRVIILTLYLLYPTELVTAVNNNSH